jgi:hypothetical protein
MNKREIKLIGGPLNGTTVEIIMEEDVLDLGPLTFNGLTYQVEGDEAQFVGGQCIEPTTDIEMRHHKPTDGVLVRHDFEQYLILGEVTGIQQRMKKLVDPAPGVIAFKFDQEMWDLIKAAGVPWGINQ